MPRVKKVTTKKVASAKKIATSASRRARNDAMSVPVYSLAGTASGSMSLPKEVFGVKVNKTLIAQAIRVYTTNQSVHPGSTKTRGEVQGSTAKIYRQKGTGRARHGAIRAPIFVGGGIVFGPRTRSVRLVLPQKMKKAALLSALSAKMSEKQVVGVTGLDKASGKTKQMVKLMSSVIRHQLSDKKANKIKALIVTGAKQDNAVRGVSNIPGVDVITADLVNAYEVLKHKMLIVTKDAVEKLK